MKQSIVEYELDNVLETSVEQEEKKSLKLKSYRPTSWVKVNRVLDIVDDVTRGRAGWVQRFFTYSFFGGCAALVNLAVFSFIYYRMSLPVSSILHNTIASVVATELSLIANFIPNDYFTFRQLAGHNRSWSQRCVRYHLTSIIGSVLTYLIQLGFSYLGHIPAVLSQAFALILVLIYNFSFHHIFTYRHVAPTAH